MNEIKNDAREFLDRAKEKISPIVEDVKEKAAPVVEDIKEKTAPVLEDIKEKTAPVVEDIKEKAAPVITKAKDAAESAIEAVKEGAEKIGSLFEEKGPGMNVKNELFDELEVQARSVKDAAQSKAEEMQRRLEELMGGKKEEPKE